MLWKRGRQRPHIRPCSVVKSIWSLRHRLSDCTMQHFWLSLMQDTNSSFTEPSPPARHLSLYCHRSFLRAVILVIHWFDVCGTRSKVSLTQLSNRYQRRSLMFVANTVVYLSKAASSLSGRSQCKGLWWWVAQRDYLPWTAAWKHIVASLLFYGSLLPYWKRECSLHPGYRISHKSLFSFGGTFSGSAVLRHTEKHKLSYQSFLRTQNYPASIPQSSDVKISNINPWWCMRNLFEVPW